MSYIFIGFLAGIISGMGIGGGTLLIPALTILWGLEQKVAQNINLIYFIPTAIIALFSHIKDKNVEKKLTIIIIGGLIGAFAGSFLALRLDSSILKKVFGAFLALMSISEIRYKDKPI